MSEIIEIRGTGDLPRNDMDPYRAGLKMAATIVRFNEEPAQIKLIAGDVTREQIRAIQLVLSVLGQALLAKSDEVNRT